MTTLRVDIKRKASVYFELASQALRNAEYLCEGKRGKRPLLDHLDENTATLVDTLRATKDYCDKILNLLEEKS